MSGYGRNSVSTLDLPSNGSGSQNGHNGASVSYNQYLADGSLAPKPQRRAGKDWLPYQGERQLIISIDLGELRAGQNARGAPRACADTLSSGTTYSGASYCILEPGKKPRIEDCRAYPGQASGLCE